jgi:hypothetical protein
LNPATLAVAIIVSGAMPTSTMISEAHIFRQPVAVISCGVMTREDKYEVALAGTLGALLTAATPKFPRDVNICLWLVYLAFVYALVVVKVRRKWQSRMTLLSVLVVGWLLATAASLAVWYGFPPDSGVSDDIPIRYMAQSLSKTTLEHNGVDAVITVGEIVNHSDKNVSLDFQLVVRVQGEDGKVYGCGSDGVWKSSVPSEFPTSIINIPRETTVNGTLTFRLIKVSDLKQMSPRDVPFNSWADVNYDKMKLRVEDKVSGVSVLCDLMLYPPSNKIWPAEAK